LSEKDAQFFCLGRIHLRHQTHPHLLRHWSFRLSTSCLSQIRLHLSISCSLLQTHISMACSRRRRSRLFFLPANPKRNQQPAVSTPALAWILFRRKTSTFLLPWMSSFNAHYSAFLRLSLSSSPSSASDGRRRHDDTAITAEASVGWGIPCDAVVDSSEGPGAARMLFPCWGGRGSGIGCWRRPWRSSGS
jgi:hypothetical protein